MEDNTKTTVATAVPAQEPVAVIQQPAPQVDAAAAERERIRAIDEIAGLFDAALVNEAKYGEHPCTAQELTYRAAQAAASQGRSFLAATAEDNQASGAQAIESQPQSAEDTNAAEIKAMVDLVNATRGGKK